MLWIIRDWGSSILFVCLGFFFPTDWELQELEAKEHSRDEAFFEALVCKVPDWDAGGVGGTETIQAFPFCPMAEADGWMR